MSNGAIISDCRAPTPGKVPAISRTHTDEVRSATPRRSAAVEPRLYFPGACRRIHRGSPRCCGGTFVVDNWPTRNGLPRVHDRVSGAARQVELRAATRGRGGRQLRPRLLGRASSTLRSCRTGPRLRRGSLPRRSAQPGPHARAEDFGTYTPMGASPSGLPRAQSGQTWEERGRDGTTATVATCSRRPRIATTRGPTSTCSPPTAAAGAVPTCLRGPRPEPLNAETALSATTGSTSTGAFAPSTARSAPAIGELPDAMIRATTQPNPRLGEPTTYAVPRRCGDGPRRLLAICLLQPRAARGAAGRPLSGGIPYGLALPVAHQPWPAGNPPEARALGAPRGGRRRDGRSARRQSPGAGGCWRRPAPAPPRAPALRGARGRPRSIAPRRALRRRRRGAARGHAARDSTPRQIAAVRLRKWRPRSARTRGRWSRSAPAPRSRTPRSTVTPGEASSLSQPGGAGGPCASTAARSM